MRGMLYRENGLYDRALADLGRAVEREPNNLPGADQTMLSALDAAFEICAARVIAAFSVTVALIFWLTLARAWFSAFALA